MFAIQSRVITVWHYLLLLILLVRCHLLLILLILKHLTIGVLFLLIECHVWLLHNKRTVWRLYAQMLFRVLLLLLINNVCHLLLLSLFVKTWIWIDDNRACLNYTWLFLLLVACRSISFTFLVNLSVFCCTVHVNVAVHLLLLQHLSLRAASLHIYRCTCWLRWNMRTLLSWLLISSNILSCMCIKFAIPSKFGAFSCSSTTRQFFLRRWSKWYVLLLRVSSCMVHRWHISCSSITIWLNLSWGRRSKVLRWFRLTQYIILINMTRRNPLNNILASLRVRLLIIGWSVYFGRKSVRLLQSIVSCCYEFHDLVNGVARCWLVDLDSISSCNFGKLRARCNMLNKGIEVSLNFIVGFRVSSCSDGSFQSACSWLEQLQILLLFVNCFNLPLKVFL